MMIEFIENTLDLLLDSAPWLVLGLVVAGLLKAWLPQGAMMRWLGGKGAASVFRAAMVGAPLPLCSCGVIPAALGLRREGASKGATVSFMISTPETGVDSVAISYALLGPVLTVMRPLAALFSAILAGLFVVWQENRDESGVAESTRAPTNTPAGEAASCCSTGSSPQVASVSAPLESCCSTGSSPQVASVSAPLESCCSSGSSPTTPAPVQSPVIPVAEPASCCSSEASPPSVSALSASCGCSSEPAHTEPVIPVAAASSCCSSELVNAQPVVPVAAESSCCSSESSAKPPDQVGTPVGMPGKQIPIAAPMAMPGKQIPIAAPVGMPGKQIPIAMGSPKPSAPGVASPDDAACCTPLSGASTGGSCCSSEPPPDGNETMNKGGASVFFQRTIKGLEYAFTSILDAIVFWLAIGLLAAGLVETLVPPATLATWGSGLTGMLVMLVVGVPMYICATASTPLAAALLFAGVSPGAVLVFLLAGPATNMATVMVVKREMGWSTLWAYLAAIVIGSLAFGFLTDGLIAFYDLPIEATMGGHHEMLPLWLTGGTALLLILASIKPIRRAVIGR